MSGEPGATELPLSSNSEPAADARLANVFHGGSECQASNGAEQDHAQVPNQDVIQVQIGAPHFKYTDPDEACESARRRARKFGK